MTVQKHSQWLNHQKTKHQTQKSQIHLQIVQILMNASAKNPMKYHQFQTNFSKYLATLRTSNNNNHPTVSFIFIFFVSFFFGFKQRTTITYLAYTYTYTHICTHTRTHTHTHTHTSKHITGTHSVDA